MDINTRKLNFIEEVLSLSNESVLSELENVLKKNESPDPKSSFHDLLGIITEEEARVMEKEIEDACEQIHEDDWR